MRKRVRAAAVGIRYGMVLMNDNSIEEKYQVCVCVRLRVSVCVCMYVCIYVCARVWPIISRPNRMMFISNVESWPINMCQPLRHPHH